MLNQIGEEYLKELEELFEKSKKASDETEKASIQKQIDLLKAKSKHVTTVTNYFAIPSTAEGLPGDQNTLIDEIKKIADQLAVPKANDQSDEDFTAKQNRRLVQLQAKLRLLIKYRANKDLKIQEPDFKDRSDGNEGEDKLDLQSLDGEMASCVNEGSVSYPCPIKISSTPCKRSTCSNPELDKKERELWRVFVELKKSAEFKRCAESDFTKKARIEERTRRQLAIKIVALEKRIKKLDSDGSAELAKKLRIELKSYQLRYHAKEFFSPGNCQKIARDLQCNLVAIWNVQDRLSYRKRWPWLVKRDLFPKLPPNQQDACFDEVILGNSKVTGSAAPSSNTGPSTNNNDPKVSPADK
jgi:hypothetical protein